MRAFELASEEGGECVCARVFVRVCVIGFSATGEEGGVLREHRGYSGSGVGSGRRYCVGGVWHTVLLLTALSILRSYVCTDIPGTTLSRLHSIKV